MITPQDLRIGNLVKYNGEFYAIKSFDEEHVVLKDNVLSEYYLDYIGYDEIEPIEITEEWLLKLGYEKDGDFFRIKNTRLAEAFIFKEGLSICVHSFWLKHIKSIHQLQNLYFALTGKELEIK